MIDDPPADAAPVILPNGPSPVLPRWRLAVGIGIPFCAVDLALPWLDRVRGTILGFPVVTAWLFAWFVLTSACLGTVWVLHDRHLGDDD
ncbi:conserved hypothetical protein [Gluconacetobacter diazotrophicus PA1 5]|uniref:DUF3311 domain-containing protein n=2 Tax=Gluconacetobacter diazotrophicus TaxID=33996 RepID=A0A7W4FDN7_GLUDI|nr:DUF3311 domain-containing protein [Gluconacetobacter diazotrophicus]ACI50549.1 conserved hypothetical protein [Gluconacetobacter diazotrophicus PA1 5]MBB2155742.1 DUF3311 domain-containing protein [Gluconacetobacter diazotrophicus]TWB09381.1 uncharacterized protein DUF3311 [Gluconacetobacter diazotrophicus]